MKLEEIKIKNFRCYKDEVTIKIDNLTCLIGRNDAGKSTILDALDCFFNDVCEISDLCVDYTGDSSFEITCVFSNVPPTIILDAKVESSLAEEGLLNQEGNLEVKRVFNVGKSLSKATYLIALYPNSEVLKDLPSLKNKNLKELAKELEIDLKNIDKTINSEIRSAIRASQDYELEMKEIKVDGSLDNDDNLRIIWRNIKKILPVYSVFKTDKKIDDTDGDVQDPMKAAIKEALASQDIQSMFEDISNRVRERSTKVAEQTIDKLKSIDSKLAENMSSEFSKALKWENVFSLTLMSDKNIPLNKRGSGVKRLVLMSFFQAQAERKRIDDSAPSIIYAMEEPETSQHPDHQMLLIESFIELSEQENVQVMFTSHSSNLVGAMPLKSIRLVKNEDNAVSVRHVDSQDDEDLIDEIVDILGVLPDPRDKIDVLVYVEGVHDISALKKYSKKISMHEPSIVDLTECDSVGYIVTGGSNMKHYVESQYLKSLGKPEVYILDGDSEKNRNLVKAINNDNNKAFAFSTQKREMENYLNPKAVEDAYKSFGINIALGDFGCDLDVPEKVAICVHDDSSPNSWESLNDENRRKKISRTKHILNNEAIDNMTIDMLKENNGYEEMKMWFEKVSSHISSQR